MSAVLLLLAAGLAECADLSTQHDLNACAYADYRTEDAALNAEWRRVTVYMKQRDAELEKSDRRPRHFDTLLAAQRAWLTFRDQHCMLEGFAMRGGSAEPMVHSGCMANLTRARTAQLKSLTETGN